jgi:phage terminase large subunit-like protein
MTHGKKVCAFIEAYCKIPEGAQVGQPMKLMAFQKKFILDVYDNPHDTSRAYLSVARKNGKSALIAVFVLKYLIGTNAGLGIH